MSCINFYNLSENSMDNVLKDGSVIRFNDLFNVFYNLDPGKFISNNLILNFPEEIDLLGINKPSKLESVIKTIIYCLSGQIAKRGEILKYRQIIQAIPKHKKKNIINYQFCFSLLPYLLIGFKTHLENRFQEDSNSIRRIVDFLINFIEIENPEIRSFLCAHRARNNPGEQKIINCVDVKKAGKTLLLQLALLSNKPNINNGSIVWQQQEVSERISSNMFPEMFIYYMNNGEVPYLISQVHNHYNQVNYVLNNKSDKFNSKLCGLDEFTKSIELFLFNKIGPCWRRVDYNFLRSGNEEIYKIAIENTLPEVKRFMPFYESKNFIIGKNAEEMIKKNYSGDVYYNSISSKAINWFYNNQNMSIFAKSLYETAFYYLWGKRSATNSNHVSIGIDRSHGEYQELSWNLGYNENLNKKNSNAIIYFRRTPDDKTLSGHSLAKISFRQFWR